MINIIFPPGCYGHFVISLLYLYTELNNSSTNTLVFDNNGSSHFIRNIVEVSDYIKLKHRLDEFPNSSTITILLCILPDENHALDYFDNQFSKNNNYDFNGFIEELFGNDSFSIEAKLKNWNSSNFINVWEIREWVSFFIKDVLTAGYSKVAGYANLKTQIQLRATDIFNCDVLYKKMQDIAKISELTFNISQEKFNSVHHTFITSQKYHGIQARCDQWVENIVNNDSARSPCQTIFDEAYVQAKLRTLGFEIQCYNLNEFPKNSLELHNLLVPIRPHV